MPINEICPRMNCTGCAACMNICPKDAVSMKEDDLGYIYPHIDSGKCIDCGMCQRICPTLKPVEMRAAHHAYAAAASCLEERSSSSSGGFASVLSRHILKRGGVVYGCAQYSYDKILHIRIDSIEDIALLKGSKYVQSETGLIYRQVKRDIEASRLVLFIGTPCQIAGLKSYLRVNPDYLYTLDLVCHGVPNQKMLRENVASRLIPTRRKDICVHFRWKAQYGIQFGIQFGKDVMTRIPHPFDPYMLAFLTGLSFRENCHQCPYSRIERVGDITIGDFWGLGASAPTRFHIRDGVSLVLPNSQKGERLLSTVSPLLIIEERTVEEAVSGNANLRTPSHRPKGKDLFICNYPRLGLAGACRIAIPRYQYYRMVIVERLKQISLLIAVYKKIRLWTKIIRQ